MVSACSSGDGTPGSGGDGGTGGSRGLTPATNVEEALDNSPEAFEAWCREERSEAKPSPIGGDAGPAKTARDIITTAADEYNHTPKTTDVDAR